MPRSRSPSRLEFCVALSGAGIFAAILTLGWGFGIDALIRRSAASYVTLPSTALSFVLLFLVQGLAGRGSGRPGRWRKAVQVWPGVALGFVALMAVANLVGRMMGHATGVDLILSVGQEAEFADAAKVSFSTAIGFLIAAVLSFDRFVRRILGDGVSLALTILVLSTCAAILVGHGFEVRSFHDVPGFSGMSEFTASGFVLLFVGLLLRDRDTLSDFNEEEGQPG